MVAVGTETDGSIVSPSSVCGVVGMKPTVGLVSRAGIIPVGISQDTAGPIARTVRDAAILLGVLAGADPRDSTTQARPQGLAADFAAGLRPGALRGARIGIQRGPNPFRQQIGAIETEAAAVLRAAGAEVIDPLEMPKLEDFGGPEGVVLDYEFKVGINAWFSSLGPQSPVKSLAGLIAFDEAHRAQEMPFFAQESLERAEARGPLTEKAYLDARAACVRIARVEGIDHLLGTYRLDAIAVITNGPASLNDPVNGDQDTGGSSSLAAVAGYPSVTVPAGRYFGLPIGMSFIGRAWGEAKLLALASDYEARARARREPEFLPTVRLR